MTEQEYIKKIDAGECFSESEIKSLVYDYDYEYKVVSGNIGRWTQSMTTIVKLCDRYFAIHWERGLTEMQEDDFLDKGLLKFYDSDPFHKAFIGEIISAYKKA